MMLLRVVVLSSLGRSQGYGNVGGDTTTCKVTPVILHRVVSPERVWDAYNVIVGVGVRSKSVFMTKSVKHSRWYSLFAGTQFGLWLRAWGESGPVKAVVHLSRHATSGPIGTP
jgi:hypothetical protein